MTLHLRLLTLYPDRMNIYADRGNIAFLRRRCQWRGIGFSETGVYLGDGLDPAEHDLFYIGGGQDRDQVAVAEDLLATKRAALAEALDAGKAMLAVCGGYQLLGHSYQLGSERLPGLGLADLETVREAGPRLIGNIEIATDLERSTPLARPTGGRLVGFENHGGRTTLGPTARPLGRVISGHGNDGQDGTEGVIDRNLIGTYLHGPLLPKNWWLTDHLIQTALESRYGGPLELAPLDDTFERAANACARDALNR